jgi:hypothetical protein
MYTRLWVGAKIFCCDTNGTFSKKLHCYRKNSYGYKKIETSITQNDSVGKNWGEKNLGKLLRILQNVIEKNFIN